MSEERSEPEEAEEQEAQPKGPALATFSERAVAISIDYGLFAVGYVLSQRVVFPDPVESVRNAAMWFATWAALFVVYQAFATSEGRSSVGKRLMGLRVVDANNEPLGLVMAIVRSVLYLPSSFMGLGFLWSLLNSSRKCWHDLAAGSVVVTDRSRGSLGGALVRLGAAVCVGLFALGLCWQKVWSPRYYRLKTVSYAYMGLQEMARLQRDFHGQKGRYADNIFELASVSIDPKGFILDMAVLFDPGGGPDFHVRKDGFTIQARARDSLRTPVSIRGP